MQYPVNQAAYHKRVKVLLVQLAGENVPFIIVCNLKISLNLL